MSATESDDNEDRKRTNGAKTSNDPDDEGFVENQINSRRKSNWMYGHIGASYLCASPLFKAVSEIEGRYLLGFKSTLGDVKPRVGMAVEICDPDHIWSSATLVKVKFDRKKQRTNVTVRYDGWGSEWDEICPWQDCVRLAKILTFTKRFKCMVDLKTFTPSSKLTCTLWPCIVHFRMPNPNDALPQRTKAENFLRSEQNIFVQPYGWDNGLLPDCVPLQKGIMNNIDGMWIHTSRVKRWRDDLKDKNKPPLIHNFAKAFKIASKDQSVPNKLPLRVFDKGSLLNAQYQVKFLSEIDSDSSQSTVLESDDFSSVVIPDSDTVSANEESAASQAWKVIKPEFSPSLPGAVHILGKIYPGENAKRIKKMGKVCATVTMGGNDFVIGTYATQYQAEAAVQAALKVTERSMEEKMKKNYGISEVINAKILEMEDITLETIVASFHKVSSKLKPKFSIHDWALQQLKYKEYLRKVSTVQKKTSRKRGIVEHNLNQEVGRETISPKRKRRLPRMVRHNKYDIS